MKKFTGNFIVIMFFGIIAMAVLSGDILTKRASIPTFASSNTADYAESHDDVIVERVSPDEMDVNWAIKRHMRGESHVTRTTHENFAAQEFITTVTTTIVSTTTSTATSTATSTDASTTSSTVAPSSPSTAESIQSSTSTTSKIQTTDKTTTVKTTSKTKTTSKATTSTKTKKQEDTNSYIKNPDYKSPYYIVVYTGSQSAVVYGKNSSGKYTKVIKSFTCSTGRKSSTPTRTGTYKIRAKYRWRLLMGGVYGQYCSSISSSYLFHSVPYNKQDPSTLSNSSYNNLGKDVSHGCIRMCVRDCKWIYDNAPIGTQVNVVTASGPAGAGVPKRKTGSKYDGWDPSDKWAKGNPYFASSETTTKKKTTTKTSKSTTTEKKTTTKVQSLTETSTASSSSKTTTSKTENTSDSTSGISDTTTSTTEGLQPPSSEADNGNIETDSAA